MAKPKSVGICKLTSQQAPLVRSHLIPKALMRLSKRGAKYMETAVGQRVTYPSDSWYDAGIVSRKGEDLLERIDAKGIAILRRKNLVWSSELPAEFDDLITGPAHWPMRVVTFNRQEESDLRLFYLSLAWRAAVSERPQFKPYSWTPL